MFPPQRRRGRKEENILLIAGEGPAINNLRYSLGNYLVPPGRDSIPPLKGLNKNDSLCVLCVSAVNMIFFRKI
jgi:hypothetical protein